MMNKIFIYIFLSIPLAAFPQGKNTLVESAKLIDIDGNEYCTSKIGNQTWMAENLKVTKYNDGTPIPQVTDKKQWRGQKVGAYCWFNNDFENYGNHYGALYNWQAVNTGKLCPGGWHVSSQYDWKALIFSMYDSLSISSVTHTVDSLYFDVSALNAVMDNFISIPSDGLAPAIKDASGEFWKQAVDSVQPVVYRLTGIDPQSPIVLFRGQVAPNETGFSALPSGYRGITGAYKYLGKDGRWWTSTVQTKNKIWSIYLADSYLDIVYQAILSNYGLSVRCVKD